MDEKWTTGVFQKIFGAEADPDKITPDDFKGAAAKLMSAQQDHTAWTFGGLNRQADGTFKDDDLAAILQRS